MFHNCFDLCLKRFGFSRPINPERVKRDFLPDFLSGICGYTKGDTKSHGVIRIYDLENARPLNFYSGFLVGI